MEEEVLSMASTTSLATEPRLEDSIGTSTESSAMYEKPSQSHRDNPEIPQNSWENSKGILGGGIIEVDEGIDEELDWDASITKGSQAEKSTEDIYQTEQAAIHEALMKFKNRRHQTVRVERNAERRIGKPIRLRRRPREEKTVKNEKGERVKLARQARPPPSPPGASTADLMGQLGDFGFERPTGPGPVVEAADKDEDNDVVMKSPINSPIGRLQRRGEALRRRAGIMTWKELDFYTPSDLLMAESSVPDSNPVEDSAEDSRLGESPLPPPHPPKR